MARRIPLYDASEPISCTIGAGEVDDRIELLERMRSDLDRIERTEHGLLLHLPPRPEVEADLRRFAADEKRCCRFWGFEVTSEGDGLQLVWDGPPAAAEVLDRFYLYFLGRESLTAIAGLL